MKLTAKLMIPRALLRSPVATEARCSGLPQDGASVRSQAARKHSKPGIFGALARRIAMASVGATFGLDANAQDTFTTPACSYSNEETGKFADGPCLMRTGTINGNFSYTLTFGDGTRVTVEYVKSNGGHHLWNINGKPGIGIEINRSFLRGATLDLRQTLSWNSSSPR